MKTGSPYTRLGQTARICIISIYPISEWHFSHVLIGSCDLEISLVIHCFVTRAKMASSFQTFLYLKIWAISEAVVLTNTKKVSYFGLSVSSGSLKIIFMLNLQQNCKNAPKKIPEMFMLVNKVPTKWCL